MITVFACALAQIKRSILVKRKEPSHTIAVIKMRVTQNAYVNLRKVHAHYARVFCEQVRRTRIKQVTLAFEFHIHRQAPFAKELAGTTATSNVIDKDLNLHVAKAELFAVEASPFDYAVAAVLGAGKALAGIAFDVNQESKFACVLGATPFAIAVGTLVVNGSVYGAAILA